MSRDIVGLMGASSDSNLAQFIFKLVINLISLASTENIACGGCSVTGRVGPRR